MKVEGRIFLGVAGFCFVMAVVYAVWTAGGAYHGVEPVGLVALLLTGGLCFITGTYFAFVSRRIRPRPEDRNDADIADGAGDVGFFSPGSYWPVTVALAAALTAIALAFWMVWLLVIAVVCVLISVGGLLFEYHTPAGRDE
ncbi:MAG: cytochrome c oxidase subunit 4 [Sciscionella sp.]|nr:cytochrome c oxidase subunit 4 [Sciscionella sp.]